MSRNAAKILQRLDVLHAVALERKAAMEAIFLPIRHLCPLEAAELSSFNALPTDIKFEHLELGRHPLAHLNRVKITETMSLYEINSVYLNVCKMIGSQK